MMSRRTASAALTTTTAALLLAACSAGPGPLPEAGNALTAQPLAADDPVYRQGRGLLVETSEDGRWTLNVVERGQGRSYERQVILIDEINGQGYGFPQLTDSGMYAEGAWVDANTFTFTVDFPKSDRVLATLEVEPDARTGAPVVAFDRDPTVVAEFPPGAMGDVRVSSANP